MSAVSPGSIKSVGVKADLRSYEHPVVLTGDLPWEFFIFSQRVLWFISASGLSAQQSGPPVKSGIFTCVKPNN